MAWTPLQSSNLDAFDYDRDLKVLRVRFKSGSEYAFRDVPADVAEGLGTAGSPGKYFASEIKPKFRPFW